MPAMPESESSSHSFSSSEADDSSSSESISLLMYALALRELFLWLEEDLEGFLEDDLEELERGTRRGKGC